MDALLALLRALYIVFGTFWVGTDIFVTFFLIPRLRTLGPAVERPVMGTLIRVMPPALMVSSVVTVVSGVMLVGALRGWRLNWLFTTGWGWAMCAGFVLTVVTLVVGFGILPPLTIRSNKLSLAFEAGSTTHEEVLLLDQLNVRITALARTNSVPLIIVVGAMAVARFV